jgi:hypothetical protein
MRRSRVELIREGKYLAEVPVELIEDETGWSPYLSLEDARKLECREEGAAGRRCRRCREAWARVPAETRVGVTVLHRRVLTDLGFRADEVPRQKSRSGV